MSGGHGVAGSIHHPGAGRLHRLAPEAKVGATVAFVALVVATPGRAIGAFALDLGALVTVAAAAHLPAGFVLRRLRVELPFVAFAAFLPVVGASPRVDVLGLSLSEPGLGAAGEILAKATLGTLAAVVLAATTPVTEVLAGLDRLRVPRVLTAIAGFMVRYLDVVVGEAARMRVARLSRADDPRWLWQARATAATAGTLFVRSYERGERVALAMAARGYVGTMPELHHRHHPRSDAAVAAVLPAVAATGLVLALIG